MAPDPRIDALKAAAAQAQRAEAVKAARENRPDFDPVKIVKKAPGGDGFDPAVFPRLPPQLRQQHGPRPPAKLRCVGTANAAEIVHIKQSDEKSLVALFGRDGVIRAALCVNSPRKPAYYRQAVLSKVAWRDVVNP